MKHTFYNLACMMLVALGCLCACQEDLDNASWTGDDNTLLLNLETTAAQLSRSAGEDEYNENKVVSADVFFFNAADGKCIYAQTNLVPQGTQLRVKLDNDKVKFGGSYYIYVIANGRGYYQDITNETAVGQTVAALKAKTITTAWKNGYGGTEIEESLLMDGETPVTISKETPGKVQLTRAMAKVALFPTVEESIEINGVTYTPQLDKMNVTMVYGVNSTNLAGNYAVQSDDYVTRILRNYMAADGAYTQAPFYSYPNPEVTTDRQNTYLILCVPWSMQTESGKQSANYYYRVPITGSEDIPATLGRNQYYKVNVHVGVLGSLNPRDAVELKGNFAIYDWFKMELSADMQHYEYLVLDEYTSVMNNVNELRMPYISSSALRMSGNGERYTHIVEVSYPDYSRQDTRIVTLDTPEEIENAGFHLTANNEELVFSHTLTEADFVPYTITIKVYNEQDVEADTWTITQYPDIYIVAEKNEYGQSSRFVNGYWEAPTSGWFDSNYSLNVYDDQRNNLSSILNILDSKYSNDDNENQYTIYITSFNAGQDYVIGDPRTSEPETLLDNRRRTRFDDLQEYYPTREDGVERMLTPAYKVASSWGGAGSMDYETAKARCAAYQENGYPAGRWRMPTEAEIEYILELSDKGEIPQLFLLSGSGQYWASSGRRLSGDGWGNSGDAYIRCVYDVWYWGDQKLSESSNFRDTDFVWGDGGNLREGDKK